ncbi:MAG: hypothetical protein P8P26_04665 [Porticoccaceae bacterium]|nr:hypothetical protein [Porticoccaceae bacterium]
MKYVSLGVAFLIALSFHLLKEEVEVASIAAKPAWEARNNVSATLKGVSKTDPARAHDGSVLSLESRSKLFSTVVRIGPDLTVPNHSDRQNVEVISIGEIKTVGTVDHSRYFTDEVEIDGELKDVSELIDDGVIKEVKIDGSLKVAGALDYSFSNGPPVVVGKTKFVEDNAP